MHRAEDKFGRGNPDWVFRQAPHGKLFYLETPQEMHRRAVWGRKVCSLCGDRPVTIELKMWYPCDELAKVDPIGFAAGVYPLDRTVVNAVPHHRMPEMHACDRCKKALHQLAASAPSWARIIIDDGVSPDAMKPIVQGADLESGE